MLYLSFQMFRKSSSHDFSDKDSKGYKTMGFKEGLALQFFNPKASLAALPIALLQYPAAHISGVQIGLVSLIFLCLGILSPLLYCILGQFAASFITNSKWIGRFNKGMALILALVAVTIFIDLI